MADDLTIAVVDRIDAVDAAVWDALFPGEPERFAYLQAVEEAEIPGFQLFYVLVRRGERLVAGAPGFLTDYRLDTTVQGPVRRVTDLLDRIAPGLLTLRLASLGSPVTETASLGVRPGEPDRPALIAALFEGLEQKAKAEGVMLMAVKDVPGACTDARLAARKARLNPMSSLPTAVLDLDEVRDEPAYWAMLSAATRKDLRRKMKAWTGTVERVSDLRPHAEAIDALYAATRARAAMQFEALDWRYFQGVLDRLGERAALFLYRVEGEVIAFNLIIGDGDGVWVDKYFCTDARGPRHNLYFVSWVENVRFVIGRGGRRLVAGQTSYEPKLRFGCRLEPTTIFFRHRLTPINAVLAVLSRYLGAEETDPTLKNRARRHGDAAPRHAGVEIHV